MTSGIYVTSSYRDRLVAKASNLVAKAIREGKLKPQTECICVDCGAQAECYDHRDYHKPLEVVPVCKGCNNRRGPGLPLPDKNVDSSHTRRTWMPEKVGRCYDGLDGGEGYSPLEYVCHVELPAERAIGSDVGFVSSGWEGMSDAIAKAGHTGKTHYNKDHWYTRALYFKERDPWAA